MKEYKLEISNDIHEAQKLINQKAAEGWEVVSASQWQGAGNFDKFRVLVTFSREIE